MHRLDNNLVKLYLVLALTLEASVSFAIRNSDVPSSSLPQSICEVQYLNTLGIPQRHCNATLISPNKIIFPKSCDAPYSGIRGFYPKVRCSGVNYEIQKPFIDDPNFVYKGAGHHSLHNFEIIQLTKEVKAPPFIPVTDISVVRKMLKSADGCQVAGHGGYGNQFKGRAIPESQRILVDNELVMDHVQEIGDDGAPYYCKQEGRYYLLGFITHSTTGFSTNKKTYFTLLSENAEWIQKNLNPSTPQASAPAAKKTAR